ncbi:hypothetical protein Tco_0407574 [Tanacetum coccineum]
MKTISGLHAEVTKETPQSDPLSLDTSTPEVLGIQTEPSTAEKVADVQQETLQATFFKTSLGETCEDQADVVMLSPKLILQVHRVSEFAFMMVIQLLDLAQT